MWFTDGTKTGPVTQDGTGQIQDCCFSASVTVMDDTVVHVMVHEASIVDCPILDKQTMVPYP